MIFSYSQVAVMNLFLQTKENDPFPGRNWHKHAISGEIKNRSDGEREKSSSDGKGEKEARFFLTLSVYISKGF